MNDFTKTELIEIKRCIQYMIKGGVTPYSGLTIEINKKLRIMYENYCEHDWVLNVQGGIGFKPHYFKCSKCEKFFNE